MKFQNSLERSMGACPPCAPEHGEGQALALRKGRPVSEILFILITKRQAGFGNLVHPDSDK